jgi:RNA polymerase subunit RPABC4/transcription elongation factor Spt4
VTGTSLWPEAHWLIQVFFLGVLVLVVYYIVSTLRSRSRHGTYDLGDEPNLCPSCHQVVKEDFRVCPRCGQSLRKDCPHCGRSVQLTWDVCPYCEQSLSCGCDPKGAK